MLVEALLYTGKEFSRYWYCVLLFVTVTTNMTTLKHGGNFFIYHYFQLSTVISSLSTHFPSPHLPSSHLPSSVLNIVAATIISSPIISSSILPFPNTSYPIFSSLIILFTIISARYLYLIFYHTIIQQLNTYYFFLTP